MPVYNGFAIPTLSMMSQAHSLNTIGNNIANISTGGFRRTDTEFSTLLSDQYDKQSDIGGVRPKDLNRISLQGNMVSSTSDLDLAINGRGFFVFNSQRDGGGDTYYGRDGTFQMAVGNTISVIGNNDLTVQTKDGWLVDKNGYYLQGYTADPVTGLFTSTALSSLRVDQYAFSNTGQTTTTASLGLNLPARDDIGYGQADSIQLVGTIEAGDVYSVTVNGTTVNYTTTGAEANLNAVRDALISAINADATIAALATASASPTNGALVITGKTAGINLTTASSATNVTAGVDDNTAALSSLQAAVSGTTHSYNIEIIDSNLNARSARLDFSKTGTNTWSLK
ncbi:MAG: flagellar hook-basal body complex protein, partial [Alphaproteobacteria bacterium]